MPKAWRLQSSTLTKSLTTSPKTVYADYFTAWRTTLDQLSGEVHQLGSVIGTIMPFPPGTLGSDMPFYYLADTAKEHLPQLKQKRRTGYARAGDAQVQDALTIATAPIDSTILHFSALESMDLVPGVDRARTRKAAGVVASSALPDVTGIFDPLINATSYSADSCQLLSEIQRHLLEPTIDGGLTWTLWSTDEVLGFLNLRIQRFMVETGLIRKATSLAAGSGDLAWPTDVMDVRRVEFNDGTTTSSLSPIDAAQADTYFIDWANTTGTPVAYIGEPKESLTFQIVPPPAAAGTLTVHYVPLPSSVTSLCAPLPIPQVFAMFIKWGVIADMLAKEGEANDPVRSGEAEGRYAEGVALARLLQGQE